MTYADLFASQPFRNQLVTMTLTGKQIKDMLEQQWLDPKRPRILQVSKGFSYAWDGSRPDGERVLRRADVAERADRSIPPRSYRVTVNNFLFVGGDGFTVLTQGTAPQIGVYDVDALTCLFPGQQPDRPDRRRSHYQDKLASAHEPRSPDAAHHEVMRCWPGSIRVASCGSRLCVASSRDAAPRPGHGSRSRKSHSSAWTARGPFRAAPERLD